MKAEVYSWRISTDLKTTLEREARRRKLSVSAVLDQAVREWLKHSPGAIEDEEEQQRLHQAASKFLGAFAGGNAHRSENVRLSVRQRLRRKHER
jgi:hypothetical protein